MKTLVFSGPTLAPDEARRVLDAVYLPPASQGDVYSAACRRPWAIGIVDGYFDHVPAIWHKEILWAMSQGIHVFGSASMGALRAAELEAFGMVGVGAIFEAFRSGELEDDDEVAVAHGPAEVGHRPLSEAMANIRFTLAAAREAGVVTRAAHDELVAIAKELFYPSRSYERLLRIAASREGLASPCRALERWLPAGRIDQKRADALAMLATIGERRAAEEAPKKVSFHFSHTAMWQGLTRQLERRPLDDATGSISLQPDSLVEELRLEGEGYLRQRDRAIARVMALELAERDDFQAEDSALFEIGRELRRSQDLLEPQQMERWLEEQELTPRAFARLLEAEARRRKVWAVSSAKLEMALRDHLRLAGRYGELAARSRDKQRALAARGLENPTLEAAGLSEAELWRWYFETRLGRVVPADLEEYAQRVDFAGIAALRRAVLRDYCFERLASSGA